MNRKMVPVGRAGSRGRGAFLAVCAILFLLAACRSPEPRGGYDASVVGSWELEQAPDRERLEFHADGTWEAWGDWEVPGDPDVVVGSYLQQRDSVYASSVYGIDMALRVRGDTLQLADGTRYVRVVGP
jgi:hypothetical protein